MLSLHTNVLHISQSLTLFEIFQQYCNYHLALSNLMFLFYQTGDSVPIGIIIAVVAAFGLLVVISVTVYMVYQKKKR